MGLLDKVRDARAGRKRWSQPNFWDVDDLRTPLFGSTTLRSDREEIATDFEGYADGILKRDGPVAALMFVRMHVFSEARFQFRRMVNGRPSDLFGTGELGILERPWPNGTTGDLLARMIQDADLSGNAYLTVIDGRVRRLRPDWVTIISGSQSAPEQYGAAIDAEVIGYLYSPLVRGTDLVGGTAPTGATLLLPDQVCHFAPIPDPLANWRGMSWLTPVLREISADLAATTHKLNFFRNGATPQLAVKLDATVTPEKFREFKKIMDAEHGGVDQAYKTLYLGGGADVTPLTMDLRQLDFKATQGASESRLAAAAGVPPVIVGFSEGLQGSSLNAGNYQAARRRMADATMRPLWRNAAGSLATLVAVPPGAELWFDDRDIAFLREDAADRAQILKEQMLTIESGVRAGFKPDSVVAAVVNEDLALMDHTGLYSVQLIPPGDSQPAPADAPQDDPPALPAGQS